ncbi:hypothetical protein FLW53_09825 [Microbispora sp. SCL1-1]|uniref:hypothetical protein n=1 Tax=unclassified Microbispora TaxID=2614687 RepID=UPI00115B7B45|nr:MULTISPECIES: hypothetical protein [unclassified Microbispora]NJP24505.1 hypothetical protein [Microbispora sp. CL1-1]TQS14649.1 hypothetical protein FLW53_09825 [Microbispora sp. SCL1-1]
MRRPLAAALLALTAAACTSEQADPATERTRLTVTQPAADHTITFEAESRDGASSLGTVIYSVASTPTSPFRHQRKDRTALPFTETLSIDGEVPKVTFTVFNDGAAAEMICRIKVDGQVVREESGSSPSGTLCTLPAGG